MEHRSEIDSSELMRQATMTAHDYLLKAVDDVEEIYGKGASNKYPNLVAAYIQTAALDMGTAIIAQQVRAGLDEIAEAVDRVAERIAEGSYRSVSSLRGERD
jgi:hypothetical protein